PTSSSGAPSGRCLSRCSARPCSGACSSPTRPSDGVTTLGTHGPDRQALLPPQNPLPARPAGAAQGGDPADQAAGPAVQADRDDQPRQAEDLQAGRDPEVAGAAQGLGPGLRAKDAGTAHGGPRANPTQ